MAAIGEAHLSRPVWPEFTVGWQQSPVQPGTFP